MFDFRKDIENGLKHFESLMVSNEYKHFTIKGNWIAFDKSKILEIDIYEVLIHFPKRYPYCFPKIYESSDKIPKTLDRHVKGDGSLCFSNPQDEHFICKKGISFKWFLEHILNLHLVREYYREKEGVYPTGERSHGNEGIWEGYFDVIGTNDKLEILKQLEMVLQPRQWARNALCYCKISGKKYKACHEKLEKIIFSIDKADVLALYLRLKQDYENKNEEH